MFDCFKKKKILEKKYREHQETIPTLVNSEVTYVILTLENNQKIELKFDATISQAFELEVFCDVTKWLPNFNIIQTSENQARIFLEHRCMHSNYFQDHRYPNSYHYSRVIKAEIDRTEKCVVEVFKRYTEEYYE